MNRKNEDGFTLLELLLAISLTIVILLILFAALRLASRSQSKGTEKAEITQKVRITGDRISWLIRGAFPLYVQKPDANKIFFEGSSDSIGFVTTSVDTQGKGPEDIAGLKWVSIYAEENSLKIREKVFFLEDNFDNTGGKVYIFIKGVKSLKFEYLDVNEDDKKGTWVTEWPSSDKEYIPAAVKVKLTIEHNGKYIEIPEMIVRINAQRLR